MQPALQIRFDDDKQKLHWDSIDGAQEYLIEGKPEKSTNWAKIYQGPDTEAKYTFPPDIHDVRGKVKKDGEWSDFSFVSKITTV